MTRQTIHGSRASIMSEGVGIARKRGETVLGSDDIQRRLEGLFRDHASQLFRLAIRMSGRRADAEDAVQEAFVRAARSVHSIPLPPDRAGAWLARTLINVQRDRARRTRVRQRAAGDLGAAQAIASTASQPELNSSIRQALEAMPAKRRAIVVMHAIEGRTVPEIAVALSVSQVTVRWHLMQARKALRPVLGVVDRG